MLKKNPIIFLFCHLVLLKSIGNNYICYIIWLYYPCICGHSSNLSKFGAKFAPHTNLILVKPMTTNFTKHKEMLQFRVSQGIFFKFGVGLYAWWSRQLWTLPKYGVSHENNQIFKFKKIKLQSVLVIPPEHELHWVRCQNTPQEQEEKLHWVRCPPITL